MIAGSGLGLHTLAVGEFLRPSVPHPDAGSLPIGAVHDSGAKRWAAPNWFRDDAGARGYPAGPRPHRGDRADRPPRAGGDSRVAAHERMAAHGPGSSPARAAGAAHGDRASPARPAHGASPRHRGAAQRLRPPRARRRAADRGRSCVVRESKRRRLPRPRAGLRRSERGTAAARATSARCAWQRLVGADRSWSADAFVLAHPSDGRSLQFVAAPFGWNERGGVLGRRFARAVFVGDPKRRTGDPIGVLNEVYGLTPGETRLTLLLLSDCSLEEAARLLGISRSTARSVLKRIFEKTGTNRQSGLVRLLLTGFAQVRPGDRTDVPDRPEPATGRKPSIEASVKTLDLYERAASLIEQLFEAPGQPQAWWRFLGALCREMSTDAIAILVGQVVPGGTCDDALPRHRPAEGADRHPPSDRAATQRERGAAPQRRRDSGGERGLRAHQPVPERPLEGRACPRARASPS